MRQATMSLSHPEPADPIPLPPPLITSSPSFGVRLRAKLHPLALLVCLFLGLSLLYNVATPLFEAPDEMDHFRYAHWLATGHGLPHLVADRAEVGEIWQPPLYYAVLALFLHPIDMSDLYTVAPFNPHWPQGVGKLAHYHTDAEAFPYRQTALAVHLARFLSSLMGVATVISTYAIARQIIPRYAVVAAALVALNPQFIFISAAVNNDNLVIALCSVALWLIVRLLDTPIHQGSVSQNVAYALLGIVWGLATLAKLTGLALGVVIGLGLLFAAWQRRSWRPLLAGGVICGMTAVAVSGWWFWRNWQLYGDPLAWEMMLAVTQGLLRPSLLSWGETLRYASFLRVSAWAMFGYGLPAPAYFYWFTSSVMLLALIGLTWGVGRPFITAAPTQRITLRHLKLALLAFWILTVAVLLLRWMRQIDTTNQGRLLFPAIAALAVWLAWGLKQLDTTHRWLGTSIAAVLGAWAFALVLIVLQPAFAQPRPLVDTTVIPHPTTIQFGDAIQLLGYELSSPTARPGEPVTLHLYWQATRPLTTSYTVFVRLLDPAGQVATGLDILPYQARYPTVVWTPHHPFRDAYQLPPITSQALPGLGRLVVGMYPVGQPDMPLPVTVNDTPVGGDVYLAPLKISPAIAPQYTPAVTAEAVFGEQFRLLGFDLPAQAELGESLPLILYWEALQPDGRDYTVFVHILDEAGQLLAQADGAPQNNGYPTSIWAAGEQVRDERMIQLPADATDWSQSSGRYTVHVGLYDPTTGQRLAAWDGNNGRYANDSVPLGSFRLTP